jgi:hypothetical protein
LAAGLGLEHYEQRFHESDIDTDSLADLPEPDLAELGISPEHRGELLEPIAALRAQAAAGAGEPVAALVQAHAGRRQLTVPVLPAAVWTGIYKPL